ncbi:hypothetical protein U2F10_04035 [Leptothoe sp. EHU-05/26/07-4]
MNIFEKYESNVRSYCRSFPAVFHRAKGSIVYSDSGKDYIDFLAGAGALNYGHNNDYIKQQVMLYLDADAITHGLDLHTSAKERFLEKFLKECSNPQKTGLSCPILRPYGNKCC